MSDKARDRDITVNRRAFHEYHFDERIEAGLALIGSEVKSLRDGHVQLKDAYARFQGEELFLVGQHQPAIRRASSVTSPSAPASRPTAASWIACAASRSAHADPAPSLLGEGAPRPSSGSVAARSRTTSARRSMSAWRSAT
jgi:hypothetical protein